MDIYGIKNCDTVKKTLKYCDAHDVSYTFHDFKKEPVDPDLIARAIDAQGWDVVINKRGTTWRKISDDIKNEMNAENAVSLAVENPSIIKRPLIVDGQDILIGYDAFISHLS